MEKKLPIDSLSHSQNSVVIRGSSFIHQAVIRQSSGGLRKSSGSHHVVVRQFKWSKIIHHLNHRDLMQSLKAPSLLFPRLHQVATIRMKNDLVLVSSFKPNSLSSQGWHTAKRKLERLPFSTSSSFVKIWGACSCEFKGYFWTFWALINLFVDLEIIEVN